MTSRFTAAVWSWFGRRKLRRGDARGALRDFQRALERRPGRFALLMEVATAHLGVRELPEARRALALAREADPIRYDLRAAAILSRCGYDLEAVCRPHLAVRPAPALKTAGPLARGVTAANLPYGDCQDIDEYARFRAMPPISPAEIEATDWDTIIGDLMDE